MKPWKRTELSAANAEMDSLQWGHGDEAVEEGTRAAATNALCRASMGPRR